MALKAILRVVLSLAALAAAGLGASQPASAAAAGNCGTVCTVHVDGDVDFRYFNYQATVDNNQNKLVVSATGKYGDHVEFFEQNTGKFTFYVDANRTFTWYLPRKVVGFRVCGPNGWGGDYCSPWGEPSLG
jgi:hypothetical protein